MSQGHAEAIARIAAGSVIARYSWRDREEAPLSYTQGMAIAFARVLLKLRAGDEYANEMAKQEGDADRDALAYYHAEYSALDLSNGDPGEATLCHAFALLLGLGMRESSGRHCEGRDQSAQNVQAETCEAGLFQLSYNSRRASPLLPPLIAAYEGRDDLLAVFSTGVNCGKRDWDNYGEGPGAAFQKLTKECPAFAVEYAAIALRNVRRQWGPITSKKAELKTESNDLFRAVQAYLDDTDIRDIRPIG